MGTPVASTRSPAKIFTLRRDPSSVAAAALPALLLLLFLLFRLRLLPRLFAGCCVELRDCRVRRRGVHASTTCLLR